MCEVWQRARVKDMRNGVILISAAAMYMLYSVSNVSAGWTMQCPASGSSISENTTIEFPTEMFDESDYLLQVSKAKKSVEDKNLFISFCFLQLSEIRKGDSATLRNIATALKSVGWKIHLLLDSPGGDHLEALSIGDIARNNSMLAGVPANGECLSSCIYVYIGAVERILYGRLGVHSPYENLPSDNAGRNLEYIRSATMEWLRRMNVSDNFFDFTTTTDPGRIRYMTQKELSYFGIGPEDPIYRAERNAIGARECSLETQMYIAMMQEINACIYADLASDDSSAEVKICIKSVVTRYQPFGARCVWAKVAEISE